MILGNKALSEEEFNIGNDLYNKRIEYLIELGKIKLSEIENERNLEFIYTDIVELNTKENLFLKDMTEKYGDGKVDLVNKVYVKSNYSS